MIVVMFDAVFGRVVLLCLFGCRWFGWFGGRGDKTVLCYIV